MGDFRRFLLLEQEEFLAQKVGDVLTALQSLTTDGSHMGNRQLIKISEKIVSQMRKILESRWPREDLPHLKKIQKAAVALARAIDSNEQMPEVIAAVTAELQKLQERIGAPINDLGAAEPAKGIDEEE